MSQPNSKQLAAEKKKSAAKPRAVRKVKSTDDIKAQIAKAKAVLAALEQRAYGSELDEAIQSLKIKDYFNSTDLNPSFKDLFARLKGKFSGVTDLAILASIGKAAGIKRLVVTQAEVKPRKPAAAKAK